MEIELLIDAHAIIGESPTWVASEQAIYWIDVKAPALHAFTSDGAVRRWTLPSDVGGFALTEGPNGTTEAAVVALRDGLFRLALASGELTILAPPPFDPALTRFNEGACNSRGRFWIGTMFDSDCQACEAIDSGRVAQTSRWPVDRAANPIPPNCTTAWPGAPMSGVTTSLTVSGGRSSRFHYDAATGRLGERRLFASIAEQLGLPDGAAIDEDGGYWCAIHGGSRLHRYIPMERWTGRSCCLSANRPCARSRVTGWI